MHATPYLIHFLCARLRCESDSQLIYIKYIWGLGLRVYYPTLPLTLNPKPICIKFTECMWETLG
jgi:hypothetical protein